MTPSLPDWIADENLLRDEAVLFGLSEARPDEKIAAIQLAFAALTAPLERQLEQEHEAVGDLTDAIETAKQAITDLTQRVEADTLPRPPVGGVSLGIGLSVSLGVGVVAGLQHLLPGQPIAGWLLAGLAGLSGCAGTLWLTFSQQRARLVQHSAQAAARAAELTRLQEQLRWAQTDKRERVTTLYATEAQLNQLTATRDRLVRLFESEFNLARSVRHRTNRDLFEV